MKLTLEQEAAILAAIEEGFAICKRAKPQPTDQELDALLDEWIGGQEGILTEHLRGFARAVLEKWGR